MRFPPPEVIMSWPTPNHENPTTRGPGLLITELTILPVALLCLCLRLYVRLFVVRSCGWDDWLMVGAAICGAGVTICVILASTLYGWDIHVWDLTLDQMTQGRQVSIAGQTIFVFASGLAKASILTNYLRIAPPCSFFRRSTWATLIVVVVAMPVFLIVLWTQCLPIKSYWNLFTMDRDCEEEGPPLMGQTITTVITDFIVVILPLPTLYKLKLPTSQRIVLLVLFGMGVVVVVASSMRAYWVHHVVEETYDVTWEGFDMWICTAVEVNLGVIAGCIPMFKPLFYKVAARTQASRSAGLSSSHFSKNKVRSTTRSASDRWLVDSGQKDAASDDIEMFQHGEGKFERLPTPDPGPSSEKDFDQFKAQIHVWS